MHPQMMKDYENGIFRPNKSWSKTRRYLKYNRWHVLDYGANPEVMRELKRRIGEYHDYQKFTEEQTWAFRNPFTTVTNVP